MPRPRFERLEPARQEAIFEAAATEFAARGYEGASLNRVLQSAGVSKGAFYYYFDDKADLFGTVVERAVARLVPRGWEEELEGLRASGYWDWVRGWMRASLAQFGSDTWPPRLARSFHRLREEPAAQPVMGRAAGYARQLGTQLLRRGQQLGVVRSDLPLELLVTLTLAVAEAGDRWLLERWSEMNEVEIGEVIEARVDLLRDMLDARNMGWES